jgi:hypothetical protein
MFWRRFEYYIERIWYFTLIYNTNEWKQKKTCRKGGNESKTGKKRLGNESKQVEKVLGNESKQVQRVR